MYKIWGQNLIDQNSLNQMTQACSIAPARKAALMPDSHLGYGLPIGGVLALENAVSPYAVGVDIACRMKLTVVDIDQHKASSLIEQLKNALETRTVFGVGGQLERRYNHKVMDMNWNVSQVTKDNMDRAWNQLGTSGSGNHFAEWGWYTNNGETKLALLTHSGSRGTGAAVCNYYSNLAKIKCPDQPLGWLDMDSSEGQEYWAAMNLMGEYAQANHDVIHERVIKCIGADIILSIDNHHNFCWLEEHDGKQLYVHRKGATPAGEGVLGIIPGSMGSPAYVVSGKGNKDSLCSASHGAGRVLSRTQAKKVFSIKDVIKDLEKQGVIVLSAGSDEVPGVYKDITEVMKYQMDLVDIVGTFNPYIVKMSKDGKSED